MKNCVVYPIPLAEMQMDKSLFTYRLDFGKPLNVGCYSWYIEGPSEKILVDAGVSAEYLSEKRGIPATEIQSLETGLKKLGLGVEDIDLVILTHLHSDHVADAHKLPKARFLIQRRELELAMNPHPTVAGQYPKWYFEGLNFEIINRDKQVCDGVKVLQTTGHTPGGQSVAIETAQGTVVISSLCTIRQNFEPPEQIKKAMRAIPPGLLVNLYDAYDSLCRIMDIADIIIANHDPAYRNVNHIP